MISINLHQQVDINESTLTVDIDQSTPMSWYWWIYNDEQILTNPFHWVNMAKSTPLRRYWQMHTDMTMSVWIYPYCWYQQIYPDKSILTNLPCWVDIDEYTPLNLYRLVCTEKSILMNLCLQININKYIRWVDINEYTIDLTTINLPLVIGFDEFSLMSQYQQIYLSNQY